MWAKLNQTTTKETMVSCVQKLKKAIKCARLVVAVVPFGKIDEK